MSSPQVIAKNPALDFELCELLGEKPADFIVLSIDGKQVPFMGTPWDTPTNRVTQELFVARLNDRSKKSLWPELFKNWKAHFCQHYNLPPETTPEQYHPVFSYFISRVCPGYSGDLRVAIGLFEALGHRVNHWSMGRNASGDACVVVASVYGTVYREHGRDMADLICLAVVRLLRAAKRAEGGR